MYEPIDLRNNKEKVLFRMLFEHQFPRFPFFNLLQDNRTTLTATSTTNNILVSRNCWIFELSVKEECYLISFILCRPWLYSSSLNNNWEMNSIKLVQVPIPFKFIFSQNQYLRPLWFWSVSQILTYTYTLQKILS